MIAGDELKQLIIGIDPGTTIGYAIFDFEKKTFSVGSKREMSKEELVDIISKEGKPSLLACDVNHAPELLLKLASYFNSRVFIPDKDMSEREKNQLVEGMKFSNEHEKDAAAAAMKAFRFYENKLRQIDRILKEKGLSDKAAEIKHLVLNRISLSNALLMVDIEREIEMPKVRGKEEIKIDLDKKNKQLKELLNSNVELRKAVDRLENENQLLRDKIKFLERGVFERLARENEIRRMEREVTRLKQVVRSKYKPNVKSVDSIEAETEEEGEPDLEGMVEEYREKHKDL
ncbi:MAG: DUF460 domain-containing protein [Candidatus Micrarchaeota archaeon]|nr:DUF460 domain-containing protein [Candidatus Micrarchaeota archaeon]